MALRITTSIHHVVKWSVEEQVNQDPNGELYKVTKITIQQKDQNGSIATTELIMFGPANVERH